MRLLLAVLVLLAVPSGAFAHVTILPGTSRPGESGEFRFRVQNERADAATIKLEVFIPDGVPVEAEPVKGTTITRIAGGIQWSGFSLAPGRSEDYKVRLGPLPDRGQLVFKALQYYADGQVVRWIQDPTEDAERPAAALDLGGGGATDGAGAQDDSTSKTPIIVLGVLLVVAVIGGGAMLFGEAHMTVLLVLAALLGPVTVEPVRAVAAVASAQRTAVPTPTDRSDRRTDGVVIVVDKEFPWLWVVLGGFVVFFAGVWIALLRA